MTYSRHKPKRLEYLLIVAALGICPAFAAPRLAVPPEGVAFGEIPAGEGASKSVELRNVSSAPVAVSQVKGCCGADAELSSMAIAPSSAAMLSVALKPMLPDGIKNLIRTIAMSSWSGPAVAFAGFGCGFLVTLLDAICTGQIYVPVLALISNEPGAWRSFGFLTLYNLAFIAPLVGVFVLASKTTDAFQMAKWSSRNVIPSKIALGIVFALLGVLVTAGQIPFSIF